jgi:Bacteriophage replication gene A protein (GPA)
MSATSLDRQLWSGASLEARQVVADFCEKFAPFSNGIKHKGAAADGLSGVPLEFLPKERRKLLKAGKEGATKGALNAAAMSQYNYVTEGELDYGADEQSINEKAETTARECRGWIDNLRASEGEARKWLVGLAEALGAVIQMAWSLSSLKARLVDVTFWKRVFRKQAGRAFEGAYRESGWVHRKGELFCSDVTLKRRKARAQENQAMLDGMDLIDEETGEVVPLADVVKGSVSNPALRRAELMTRIRGFEEYAVAKGHSCLFVTCTAPSAHHRVSERGRRVAAWNGSTPREVQDYMMACWARVRAKWQRSGFLITPYGFRVTEPHHDGTPHWHMVLFCGDQDEEKVRASISAEFMAEAPNERGAKKYRVTFIQITASSGGAAGYLSKYIAKNIDGFDNGQDTAHDEAIEQKFSEGAARVLAWASRWGIRQFQQIGGPSVTVWRELRRLRESQQGELFERARIAADGGQWVDFFQTQGGANLARRHHKIQTEAKPVTGTYGDEIRKVIGLVCGDGMRRDGLAMRPLIRHYITHARVWMMRKRSRNLEAQRASVSTRTSVNNCTNRTSDKRAGFGRNTAEARTKTPNFAAMAAWSMANEANRYQ